MKDSNEIVPFVYTGNEVVVQDNRLIESPKGLSLQEAKLFLLIISKVNPKTDSDFSTFRISVSEYAKALNLKQLDYNEFRKVVKKLLKRTMEIKNPKEKHDIEFPLLSRAEYFYGKGYAELRINDTLKPYLLQLNQQFTLYNLPLAMTFSSSHAIYLYELMERYENIGTCTISIDKLKEFLRLSNSSYSRVNNLKIYVLDIALREINQKTDLNISYSFQKTGQKFSEIVFKIESKVPKIKTCRQITGYISADENPDNIAILKSLGYAEHQARKLLEFRKDEDVKLALAAVQEQIKKKEPKNIKGFVRSALDKKWKPNGTEEIPKSVRRKKTIKETTEADIEDIKSDQIETDKTKKSGFNKFGNLLSDLSNFWRNKNGKK